MNIAITGGGTGGHLTIAKAIKEELNQRGIMPIFIGSMHGQDRAWFEEDSGWRETYFLQTSGVVNKKGIAKLAALRDIAKATLQTRKILKEKKIDVLFSVGGYSAAPASLSAIMMGKKFYIHEQNAVMGRLNRLLASKATMLFSSYHDSSVTDYPVRDIYFEHARLRTEIKTILFLGGSQGASALNDFALRVAKNLTKQGIKIIHQCGSRDLEKCQNYYHDNAISADVFDFSTGLEEKVSQADFAICRAGASTVWELTASQLPALFVPYPHAAGNHQYHNAKFLEEKGLAVLVNQEDLEPHMIDKLLQRDILSMSRGLASMVYRDGVKNIVDVVLEV